MPGEAGTGTGSESLQGGSSLRASLNNAALLLVVQASSTSIPFAELLSPSHSPHDVSSWPTTVLCLGLLSKPHVPAPSPCLHWRTPSQAGWAGQGSVLCVPASLCPSRWLPCSLPTENKAPFLSQLSSHPVRSFPGCGDLSSLQIPPGICGSHPASFPLPCPQALSCPTWLSRNLSCLFRCPCSSARVPQGSVKSFPLQDVFLMLLWREMNSTSSESYAIVTPSISVLGLI